MDGNIAEYERLTTFDPENDERYLMYPKDKYRLDLFYEQKGWAGKAIEHYQELLDLWKEADISLIEVESAKRRTAMIKRKDSV